MQAYLTATTFIDCDHPRVMELAQTIVPADLSDIEKARALYLWVRDEIRYNPYSFRAQADSFKASFCLQAGESYCIPKAVLLAALARAHNIPARLGFADVRNHLSSEQLLAYLRTDVFAMHGYCELLLAGRWVKATPAFNRSLCEKMGVEALTFNGWEDSVFQAYDGSGQRYMEYLQDHGQWADLPYALILRHTAATYPHLAQDTLAGELQGHSLEGDLALEEKAADS